MNLHKIVKGILVHNGYFFVKDVMKHFIKVPRTEKKGDAAVSRYIQDPCAINRTLDYEFELQTELKTDPKLDGEQIESIARELERLSDLYEKLMLMSPLEFNLGKFISSYKKINQSLTVFRSFEGATGTAEKKVHLAHERTDLPV